MCVQFYAMVNFCNPGVLGTPAEFRKKYERPILEGREPGVGAEKVTCLHMVQAVLQSRSLRRFLISLPCTTTRDIVQ
jgi:DNA repair and recombination protein RAD54 and RAD54-like protein